MAKAKKPESKFETLDKVDLVSIDCTIWSGWKRLQSNDIELGEGGKLPPEEVATLGSKRIINPDDLAVFHALKKRAERTCLTIGTRFLGGYAVPREKTEELATSLDEIAQSFDGEKQKFLERYDQAVESWLAQHPEFERQLREAVTPRDHVESRLGFEYGVCRIAATAAVTGHLDKQVNRLGSQLLHEVASEASALYERSLAGGASVDRKAPRTILGAMLRMREKLAGLAFLDESIEPMVQAIDRLFASAPKTGHLEGSAFDQALALALILSDPDKVRRHADVGLEASGISLSETDAEVEKAVEQHVARTKQCPVPTHEQGSLYF